MENAGGFLFVAHMLKDSPPNSISRRVFFSAKVNGVAFGSQFVHIREVESGRCSNLQWCEILDSGLIWYDMILACHDMMLACDMIWYDDFWIMIVHNSTKRSHSNMAFMPVEDPDDSVPILHVFARQKTWGASLCRLSIPRKRDSFSVVATYILLLEGDWLEGTSLIFWPSREPSHIPPQRNKKIIIHS